MRAIDNLEDAFVEMYEFITDLPSGLDGFESDFDEAFKELENLKVAIAQPGEPLTLDQLREMDGQPVWCEDVGRWAIVSVSDAGKWKGVPFALFEKNGGRFEWNVEDRELSLYSYPPTHIDRSKWISVKERLPDFGIPVLICWDGYTDIAEYWCGMVCPKWRTQHYGTVNLTSVTHWMPLPEPPEEG